MKELVEPSRKLPAYEPLFHADDAEQVVGYRTVSALAVVGLVFGLASPLCFAWPLLLGIPLLGAVISILALRRIDVSDGALAGRWVAMIGLVLCVVSGTAAVSRDQVARTIRIGQAEEFGRDWIEMLLAGDTQEAFRLTVAGNRREPTMPEPGTPPPTKTPYEQFLEHPIIAELAAAGRDSEIRPGATTRYEPQHGRQFVIQKRFAIEPHESSDATHPDKIDVLLTVQRSRLAGERQPRWLVADHESSHAPHDPTHVH